MSYKVIYSKQAGDDPERIYRYIAEELSAPLTAKKQIRRIINAIRSLDELPGRNPKYDKEPWNRKGLRVLRVNNYLVFYFVFEDDNTVLIVTIMFNGRDVQVQLEKLDM